MHYLILALALFLAPLSGWSAEDKPNVVIIFIDDQGYYDLGCYGATEIETPRLDQLASEGIRFTDYYAAAPICSPSRAGLLTGAYPRRIGMETWVQRADSTRGIHPDEVTMAELFKANGYATACVGKWHLGDLDPFVPMAQGFDYHFGMYSNLDPVETVYFGDEGVPILRNGEVVKRPADPAELTRLYTEEAIEFVKRKKDEPFFLYLPHTMLHNPLGVSPEFQGSSQWGEYGDAIQELDHGVGRFMDTLTGLGLDDKTIVVYASDNGRGPGRNPQQALKGRKLTIWECGIRVPAIIRAPGLGVSQGKECREIVSALDWFPTLATAAGIRIPKDHPIIDGRDLWPLMTSQSEGIPSPAAALSLNADIPLRRRWEQPLEWKGYFGRQGYLNAFFYHGSQGALAAVRSGKHKMVLNPQLTVYDLEADPGETTPIRGGDVVRKLRGMAVMFQEEMSRDARQAGEAPPEGKADGRTVIPQATLDRLDAKLDVTYARYGDRTLEMDIYRPKGTWGVLPALVCVHGGGWAKGSRINHAKVAQALAARGYVAATISYRLSGEEPFPAQIQDCKAAVRFLRANAKQYGIDSDNIGAIGHSAGGHLVALLASSCEAKELEGEGGNADFSSAIQAAVPMGAQTDLMSERTREVSSEREIWQQFLSGSQEEQPATYRLASPLSHLDKNDPPCWFITGENDDPSTRADAFRQQMEELGIPSDLTVIEGAPHPFTVQQTWFDEMIEAADAFFTSALK